MLVAVAIAVAVLLLGVGLFTMLFRRGRRRMGLWLTLAGAVVFVVTALIDIERQARADGWREAKDRSIAAEAGFADAAAWYAHLDSAEAEAREEERGAGFHCLSDWDGSHRDFRAKVVEFLRDPDSFDLIETRITPVDADGRHQIFMTYRARNGFGGMDVATAKGLVANADCSAQVISVE